MKLEKGKEITKMKKHIPILLLIILSLTLSSCIKIYLPDNQNTDSSNNTQTDTDCITNNIAEDTTKNTPKISRVTVNKDIYISYNLGEYYGSGFKFEDPTPLGKVEYEIIQTYAELKRDTEYGTQVDEALFDSHVILVVKFPHTADKKGLLGFKDLRIGTAGCFATQVTSGLTVSSLDYFYYQIPKNEIIDWENSGIIELRKESFDYISPIHVDVPRDFMEHDTDMLILTGGELIEYIADKNLPINFQNPTVPYYIVFFSTNQFTAAPSFIKPIVSENSIKLVRDYSISDLKTVTSCIDIIPLMVEDISTIENIEISSEYLKDSEFFKLDYKLDNSAIVTYKCGDFYKNFNGGVYYGIELANKQRSSYTIIENYSELLDKAEFYIDREIFEDNYVLVLKLVGESDKRLGFRKATPYWIDTTDGEGICSINIQLYVTPIFNEILNDGSADLQEKLKDEIPESINGRVEYEYIVVPKVHLRNVRKTGDLNIEIIDTFASYTQPKITKEYFNSDGYNVKTGEVWRIQTKAEMEDFNNKYGTSFTTSNLGFKYNKEYIIVYLTKEHKIFQSALSENGSNVYLSYLIDENAVVNSKYDGYFLKIEKASVEDFDRLYIDYICALTKNTYNSYYVDQSVNSYDFYQMKLEYSKEPVLDKIILTEYSQFEEIFNKYKHDEYENITADTVFNPSVFEDNYVIVFSEYSMSNEDLEIIYNARVGGNKTLYLYATKEDDKLTDLWYYYDLYFVAIPKNEIFTEISNVMLQYTKSVVYNGPFESVTISSTNQETVKLDKTHVVIDSLDELIEVFDRYDRYEKLQNIDFENYFVLAFNRKAYTTIEYDYGDFVDFKTSVHGTASITFVAYEEEWLSDSTKYYVLDFVVIPRELMKHDITYFYVSYAKNSDILHVTE